MRNKVSSEWLPSYFEATPQVLLDIQNGRIFSGLTSHTGSSTVLIAETGQRAHDFAHLLICVISLGSLLLLKLEALWN
jgi:hypothetical protein